MKKLFFRKNNKGMTMAEVLIVVAIIGVLMGLAIPNIMQQQRNLKKMELDRTAKEIYLAVQNSFITLERNGHLDEAINGKILESGSEPKDVAYPSGKLPSDYQGAFDGTFYTFYSGDGSSRLYTNYIRTKTLQALGFDFVVEYTSNGDVYSVFYAEDVNVAGQLKKAGEEADLSALNNLRSNDKVGYYSTLTLDDRFANDGEQLIVRIKESLKDGDELYIPIGILDTNLNYVGTGATVNYKVTFTGNGISVPKEYTANVSNLERVQYDDGTYLVYKLVLDRLSTPEQAAKGENDVHFYEEVLPELQDQKTGEKIKFEINDVSMSLNGNILSMKPGEPNTTPAFNPLHAIGGDSSTGNIAVSCARHLNNLDEDYFDASKPEKVAISQTGDIDASILPNPIRNDVLFTDKTEYTGNYKSISNLNITSAEENDDCAALFAEFNGCTIKNLSLIDPYVSAGTQYAGTLVGKVSGGAISNCGARKTAGNAAYDIEGSGQYVGGLIGYAKGTAIDQSYAAVNVHGTGGFAGVLNECSEVEFNYSSGIVTGNNNPCGGFAASITGTVSDCYTTSDVVSDGKCGGFAYMVDDVLGCNSYGRVWDGKDAYNVSEDAAFFAFSLSHGYEEDYLPDGCNYLYLDGIYNDPEGGINGIACGAEYDALARTEGERLGLNYSNTLTTHGNKFPFENTGFINPHYGDWPHCYQVTGYDSDCHCFECKICVATEGTTYSKIEEAHIYVDGDTCIVCKYQKAS